MEWYGSNRCRRLYHPATFKETPSLAEVHCAEYLHSWFCMAAVGGIIIRLFLIVDQMPDLKSKKIIIEGVTTQGKEFRPSDWAERMSGALASFKNSRIHYSPLLQ